MLAAQAELKAAAAECTEATGTNEGLRSDLISAEAALLAATDRAEAAASAKAEVTVQLEEAAGQLMAERGALAAAQEQIAKLSEGGKKTDLSTSAEWNLNGLAEQGRVLNEHGPDPVTGIRFRNCEQCAAVDIGGSRRNGAHRALRPMSHSYRDRRRVASAADEGRKRQKAEERT